MGPFVGINEKGPLPTSPKIPMGTSAYKMQFSPMKNIELPKKLQEPYSFTNNNLNSSGGLRHLSNGDAFHQSIYLRNSVSNVLNNSADLRQNSKNGVVKAQNVSYDQRNDDFRFKILK
mmetsp:Transcript_26997/g.31162  ORF Transcript_26997/g.31162 Transcript_26997/m.31162 type:complete len:118 (-) Transcript_26997:48-401(-)